MRHYLRVTRKFLTKSNLEGHRLESNLPPLLISQERFFKETRDFPLWDYLTALIFNNERVRL